MSEFKLEQPRAPETSLETLEKVEVLRSRFYDISSGLTQWHEGEADNRAVYQRNRAEFFYRTCTQLHTAVSNSLLLLPQGYKPQLVTGQKPVTGWMFVKGSMDFYSPISEELPPETTIDIMLAQNWITKYVNLDHPKPTEYYQNPKQLFIGGLGKRLITASVVARTLSEGGELRIVETELSDQ